MNPYIVPIIIGLAVGIPTGLAAKHYFTDTCEDFLQDYVRENNLDESDIQNNGEGYWWVSTDEHYSNCLDPNGRMEFVIPLVPTQEG